MPKQVFFRVTGKTQLEKSEKLQKNTFQEIVFFSITEQLFAKLLSHSSNTVGHHWTRIWKFFQWSFSYEFDRIWAAANTRGEMKLWNIFAKFLSIFSRRFSKKNADCSSDFFFFFFFKTNELTDFINFISWPTNTKLPLLPHYFTATLLHCHLA